MSFPDLLSSPGEDLTPLRVLLVEDDDEDYLLTRDLLRNVRSRIYRVDRAKTWDEAWSALVNEDYDLCVVDYHLGAKNGLEFIQTAVGCGAPVPMILLTGGTNPEIDNRALQYGAADYLHKDEITSSLLDRSLRYAQQRGTAAMLLNESRRFLASTLDALTSHIAILDEAGNVIAVNEAWKTFAVANCMNVESYGVGFNYIKVCEQAAESGVEGAAAIVLGIQQVLANVQSSFYTEYPCHSPAEHRWYAVRVTRFRDSHPLRLVVAHDNITVRVAAEQALATERKALVRSNEDLQQFAYTVSHDLQEPLRMVSSFTRLLAQRYSGRLDSDADEFIHYAHEGSERMVSMISGLLQFSRVGGDTTNLKLVDSGSALKRALDSLALKIEDYKAQIITDALPVVRAHPGRVTQLFQNLVENAIKYTKREEKPVVRISAAPNGNEYLFSVADNGIGFDSRQAERIFGVFTRLHRNEYAGTGIGLAICKRIVQTMGGRIWAESTPGKGSTFFFTVPIPSDVAGIEETAGARFAPPRWGWSPLSSPEQTDPRSKSADTAVQNCSERCKSS